MTAVTQTCSCRCRAADISLLALFLQAHIVVKVVIVGLLLASVWSWAIIVDKTLLYSRIRRQMDRFEKVFWSGQSLEELYRSLSGRTPTAMASVFVAAMREWKRSFEAGARSPIGLQTRIDKVLDVTIDRETERLERRLLFLATVGSAAPFIGLFGTVWGIMTSFQAIAASKNTALAVVAPGIAEALLATALGLLAAIPAVIAYNKLSNDAGKIGQRLEGFADEFSAILSRQVDERASEPWPRRSDRAGSASSHRRRRARPMSEINVTPFVDVMLVLLIVFMVSAPLLTAGVPVDLPEAQAKPLALEKEPITVTVDTDGQDLPQGRRGRDRRARAEADGAGRRTVSTSASMCAATRRRATARSCASWARSTAPASAISGLSR